MQCIIHSLAGIQLECPQNSTKMKTRLKLSIFMIILATAIGEEWIDEMKAFLTDNGLKHVTLVENSTTSSAYARKLASNLYERADFYLRRLAMERYTELYQDFHVDVQIFLFDQEHDDMAYLLQVIKRTKVKRSIMLLSRPWKGGSEDHFKMHLSDTPNLFFYVASPLDSSTLGGLMSWQQVITLMTGYTINDLKFEENSYTLREDFDFNGLKIRSMALTWAPFLTINDCNDKGTDCATQYGYLVDYIGALAKDLNFTLESFIDQGRNLMEFFSIQILPDSNFDLSNTLYCQSILVLRLYIYVYQKANTPFIEI